MTSGIFSAQRRRKHSPPAPPDITPSLLTRRDVDYTMIVAFDEWTEGGQAYTRFQVLAILDSTVNGPIKTVGFHGTKMPGFRTLLGSTYTLLVDDVAVAQNNSFRTISGVPNAGSDFTLDISLLSEGWHKFDIAVPAGEYCPVFYFYVKHQAGLVPAQSHVPVCSGSWDIEHHKTPHWFGMIPNGLQPTPKPLSLPARECPEFSTAINRSNLFRENIVPQRTGNVHRVARNKDGIDSTFNVQPYHFNATLIAKFPAVALLDGPRGVGTVVTPTHLQVDRHGNAYGCDPWRIFRLSADGTVTTRAGYRHFTPPAYWGAVSNADRNDWGKMDNQLELVGDWSPVIASGGPLGFHELWGLAFDQDSLVQDENLPQQQNPETGEMEHPHPGDVRLFVSDTQNNRICLLSFPGQQFGSTPVVSEFITGLQDPWDVVWDSGKIYVSERLASRIVEYDAATGAFLRVVVSGPPEMAKFQSASSRTAPQPNTGYTLDDLRAQDVVWPEGLATQDGWLYYGSIAAQIVKRVHLQTGEIQVVGSPHFDINSNYLKIALSDGSFGPRGTVFMTTWSNAKGGFPEAVLPPYDGTKWQLNTITGSGLSRGKGGLWDSLGYAAAVGCGLGRLLCGSSDEGLVQLSQALPGDTAPTSSQISQYNRGKTEFKNNHYLIHGWNGFGYHGYELPWGESADMDFYLQWQGHIPPA